MMYEYYQDLTYLAFITGDSNFSCIREFLYSNLDLYVSYLCGEVSKEEIKERYEKYKTYKIPVVEKKGEKEELSIANK